MSEARLVTTRIAGVEADHLARMEQGQAAARPALFLEGTA